MWVLIQLLLAWDLSWSSESLVNIKYWDEKLTEGCSGVNCGEEEGGGNPGYPGGHSQDHQEEDGVGFLVVILDMFILDREGTDEDDEEEDVSQWEDVVTGLIAAGLFQPDPLQWYDHLGWEILNTSIIGLPSSQTWVNNLPQNIWDFRSNF